MYNSCVDYTNNFKTWFWGKFEEWRKGTVNGPTAFAAYLGVKQQYVSRWLDGKSRPQSLKIIKKLAETYPDVYDILGIEPTPEEDDLYSQVPPPYRDQLRAAINEITANLIERELLPESPEGKLLAREIFFKHGFDVSSIEIKDDPSNGAML